MDTATSKLSVSGENFYTVTLAPNMGRTRYRNQPRALAMGGSSSSGYITSLAATFISHVETCQRLDSNADSNNGFKTQTLLNILAIDWKKILHSHNT